MTRSRPWPDDDDQVLGIETGDGGEDVPEEAAPGDLVQDLRRRRHHARSLTSGEDDHGGRSWAAHEGVTALQVGGRGGITLPRARTRSEPDRPARGTPAPEAVHPPFRRRSQGSRGRNRTCVVPAFKVRSPLPAEQPGKVSHAQGRAPPRVPCEGDAASGPRARPSERQDEAVTEDPNVPDAADAAPAPVRRERTERVRMSGRERREQLIDVGRKLFAAKGFEVVTIEEIAAKAGVSKPVVYEHFGSKDGLYAVIVDREMNALMGMVSDSLTGSSGGARDLLEKAGRALFDYIETHNEGFRILVRDSPVSQTHRQLRLAAARRRQPGRGAARPRVRAPGLPAQARADVRQHARRHGRAHRPVVARRPQAQEGGGRRPRGEPRLERPRGPGEEAHAQGHEEGLT